MRKKVLVTGGAGFIGSNLCNKLLEQGNIVYCLDNFSTSSPENIKGLLKNKDFFLIKHDITKEIDIEVDEIYHLACPASPKQYRKLPIETLKTSLIGSFNVLELARKYGAKVLFTSTSEVYGDPLEHPQKEEYRGNVNPIGPRACYDEGKRCAETIFNEYRKKFKLNIKIVRIFNTYGPKMSLNDGRVISNFIIQALENSPITIYGTGEQTRSFCFIDDIIEGLLKMMNTPPDIFGPINLGNPKEIKIKDLATLIKELCNSKSELVFERPQPEDPLRRRPDISKAKAILDWEPKTSLIDGLRKTIDYFRKELNRTRIIGKTTGCIRK